MNDAALFTFISSYRGEHDHRRAVDGRRYRYGITDPTRTIGATDGRPVPTDAVAEWRRYRIAQRAEFLAWIEDRIARGLDPGAVDELVTDAWPELATP